MESASILKPNLKFFADANYAGPKIVVLIVPGLGIWATVKTVAP